MNVAKPSRASIQDEKFPGADGMEYACRRPSLAPSPYAGLRSPGSPHDLVGADAVARQQHDLSAPRMLLRRIAVLDDPVEPISVGRGKADRDTTAHPT